MTGPRSTFLATRAPSWPERWRTGRTMEVRRRPAHGNGDAMSNETLLSLTGAVIVVLVAIRIYRWMELTADLRLSLFRPYRGDAWPQGVQEDDEVHWQWTDDPTRPTAHPPTRPDPARYRCGGRDRPARTHPRSGRSAPRGRRRPQLTLGPPAGRLVISSTRRSRKARSGPLSVSATARR